MPAADDSKRKAARETIDILHEISTLLVRDHMKARKPQLANWKSEYTS